MNYYEILEVSPNASVEVIKNAYRALSKKYHPDIYVGDKKYAESRVKEINEAYETLIDEEKRLSYDYENGFKVDPNAIVEEFEEAVQAREERKEEPKREEKLVLFIKQNKILVISCTIIAFVLAFVIGINIAKGTNKEKTENTNVVQIETEETNNDSKYNPNNNYYINNNKTEDSSSKDKENTEIEEKKEEIVLEDTENNNEEVTPNENMGIS